VRPSASVAIVLDIWILPTNDTVRITHLLTVASVDEIVLDLAVTQLAE
jgi:hypothetical protein